MFDFSLCMVFLVLFNFRVFCLLGFVVCLVRVCVFVVYSFVFVLLIRMNLFSIVFAGKDVRRELGIRVEGRACFF